MRWPHRPDDGGRAAMGGGIDRGQAGSVPRGPSWCELAGTMGCPVSGSGDDGAVRLGVGWRAVVPGRH